METLYSFLLAVTVTGALMGVLVLSAGFVTRRREVRRISEIVGWVSATATKKRPVELRQITARAVQWGDGGLPFRAYARHLKIWEWPTGERIVIVATWVDHLPSQDSIEAAAGSIQPPAACQAFRVSERELIVNVRRLGDRRESLQAVLTWMREVLNAAGAEAS